jgi:isochorismate synthase/2-succinyl-5-enolpyruvyl-6-hydroxy-3-cyclohexene-1-carboxylate synthase/2-succinyl-6-hydroxy-2,4-cyclohexadiene-1-carboxylate synthase/O-succinylbenzoate synthase
VALDESLDEGALRGELLPAFCPIQRSPMPGASRAVLVTCVPAPAPGAGPALDASVFDDGGLAALVVKPAVLAGGLEEVVALARWAKQRGARAVVSSAFESSVGVAALAQLAAALDADVAEPVWPLLPAPDLGEAPGGGTGMGIASSDGSLAAGGPAASPTAHGLGTLSWFEQDSTGRALELAPLGPEGLGLGVTPEAAQELLDSAAGWARPSRDAEGPAGPSGGGMEQAEWRARLPGASRFTVRIVVPAPLGTGGAGHCYDVGGLVVEPAGSSNGAAAAGTVPPQTVLLLHGFLGDADDWAPLAGALAAAGYRVVAPELPGHGATAVLPAGAGGGSAPEAYATEAAAGMVLGLARALGLRGVVLAGYSMGARVALAAAAAAVAAGDRGLVGGLALMSGTPGVQDPARAAERAAADRRLAQALVAGGLERFLEAWYARPMWASLRASPRFPRLFQHRQGRQAQAGPAEDAAAAAAAAATVHEREHGLAASLCAGSTGRMAPLWRELPSLGVPVALVAGERDGKFVATAQAMARRLQQRAWPPSGRLPEAEQQQQHQAGLSGGVAAELAVRGHTLVVLPGVGHAAHVEAPLAVVHVLVGLLRHIAASSQGEDGV